MTHFAKLDENNVVVAVVKGRIEDEGREAELSATTGETYVQTSYNTHGGIHQLNGKPFRKNFAGIGFRYEPTLDAFIPPQPFPSWILNVETCLWESPIGQPNQDGPASWDETNQKWVSVE